MDQVVIYRSFYGQLSETFVRDHVHGLRQFHPLVLANRVDPHGPTETADMEVVPNAGLLSGCIWRRGGSRRTHALLSRTRPALIHAHFLTDGASILPYARALNIPLVVTAHGYDATTWPEVQKRTPEGRLLLARQAELAAYATRIFCVSEFIRDELITRGYPRDRLVMQPLGVDMAAIRPRPEGPKRGILTVGRLVEKKGTRFLIEAYAKLPPALRAVHPLNIIGDGPLREELEMLAQKSGVVANFVGPCSRAKIFEELSSTALFCLPSVRAKSGDAEGMPIAIMEALALQVPVVVFDGQAAGKLLDEAKAGAVAQSADSTDLSKLLISVMTDPKKTKIMAQKGRSLAEKVFDLSKNNASIEFQYLSITSS